MLVQMTEDEALKLVHGYASANRYEIHPHAWSRMRGIGRNLLTSVEDVHHALCEARRAVFQPDSERWKVEGPDRDGDDLSLVVVIDDGLVVVTVF